MELGDADVSQIMTPRTDMISIPASCSWDEMLQQAINGGHTRIPVYGRNRDDILGILHTKDLLPELAREPEKRGEPWTKLLRQPVFVPETKPIDALLQELQRGRNHMVVVLDEYGGVSGLVTMEDVLEEIVGEIVDEYDAAHVEGLRELAPGVCEALGRVHIDEINERLGLELPEDADYDTIGGFVFNELGHIPTAGEDLLWRNVRITVLDATRRRIERVRIEVLDAAGLPPARSSVRIPRRFVHFNARSSAMKRCGLTLVALLVCGLGTSLSAEAGRAKSDRRGGVLLPDRRRPGDEDHAGDRTQLRGPSGGGNRAGSADRPNGEKPLGFGKGTIQLLQQLGGSPRGGRRRQGDLYPDLQESALFGRRTGQAHPEKRL